MKSLFRISFLLFKLQTVHAGRSFNDDRWQFPRFKSICFAATRIPLIPCNVEMLALKTIYCHLQSTSFHPTVARQTLDLKNVAYSTPVNPCFMPRFKDLIRLRIRTAADKSTTRAQRARMNRLDDCMTRCIDEFFLLLCWAPP
jgi:hypothetical protein